MKIICVSFADSGRHDETCDIMAYTDKQWTELSQEIMNDEKIASLFQGTANDLVEALNSDGHPSHYLAENCDELCLGDYL